MFSKTYRVMLNEVKHLAESLQSSVRDPLLWPLLLNAKADAAGVARWFA